MATVTEPSIKTRKITADEFMELDLGEGLHELVDGEIIEVPQPEYLHGYVCGRSYFLLETHGRTTGHGHAATNDSAVRLDEFNVRGADVSYYSEARWPRARVGREKPPFPPDVVVEVISPSNRQSSLYMKIGQYLEGGVLVVLVLHPSKKNLTIYRDDADVVVLNEADALENLPELPGFHCRVSDFFA